ncbi:MAG: hypothetical protein PHC85_03175 [Candidatus Pacebacteria bacterium]|nr:hypothetical protein [Candidatus Paceibacterota bacterium]
MPKKLLTIIISAGIIILGTVSYFLFFNGGNGGQNSQNDEGFFSSFFPESSDKESAGGGGGEENFGLEQAETQTPSGVLSQISDKAVVAPVFNPSTQKIQYFDKATGRLFETETNGKNKNQLTINTIPEIFEAFWSFDLKNAVLRYPENSNGFETLKTFLITNLATSTEGVFLPTGVSAVSFSPAESKIFYLSDNDTSHGIIANTENQNRKEIINLPFKQGLVEWPQSDVITALTRPTALAEGYFYKINPKTGALSKIIDGKGLTAVYSKKGEKTLYSLLDGENEIATRIYDNKDKTTITLGIKTFPEKCLFSKNSEDIIYCAVPDFLAAGDYPEAWYKGLVSFSDSLWQLDVKTGAAKLILKNTGLDIINIFTDASEEVFFFQNKKDGVLWRVELSK